MGPRKKRLSEPGPSSGRRQRRRRKEPCSYCDVFSLVEGLIDWLRIELVCVCVCVCECVCVCVCVFVYTYTCKGIYLIMQRTQLPGDERGAAQRGLRRFGRKGKEEKVSRRAHRLAMIARMHARTHEAEVDVGALEAVEEALAAVPLSNPRRTPPHLEVGVKEDERLAGVLHHQLLHLFCLLCGVPCMFFQFT